MKGGIAMRGRCGGRGIKNALGILLIAAGVIVLLCFIPFWCWIALLGGGLLIVGILCIWG
jgi:hypothetical protein